MTMSREKLKTIYYTGSKLKDDKDKTAYLTVYKRGDREYRPTFLIHKDCNMGISLAPFIDMLKLRDESDFPMVVLDNTVGGLGKDLGKEDLRIIEESINETGHVNDISYYLFDRKKDLLAHLKDNHHWLSLKRHYEAIHEEITKEVRKSV